MSTPMSVERRAVLAVGVTAAIILLIAAVYQHYRGPSQLKQSVRDSVAVLTASKKPDSIQHADVIAKAETVFVESTHLSAASKVTEHNARAFRSLADSAARLAERSANAHDSATHYRNAFEAERSRGDTLEHALVLEHAAADSARASALRYRTADSLSQFRLGRVERLNVDLVKEVERISTCRLLPGIPCPSRKATAIGAAAITYALTNRSNIPFLH